MTNMPRQSDLKLPPKQLDFLEWLGWPLMPGAHLTPDRGACLIETARIIHGYPFETVTSAAAIPKTFSPTLSAALLLANDNWRDLERQRLLPLVLKLEGSGGPHIELVRGRAKPRPVEAQRRRLLVEGALHELVPPLLDVAGLDVLAHACRTTDIIRQHPLELGLAAMCNRLVERGVLDRYHPQRTLLNFALVAGAAVRLDSNAMAVVLNLFDRAFAIGDEHCSSRHNIPLATVNERLRRARKQRPAPKPLPIPVDDHFLQMLKIEYPTPPDAEPAEHELAEAA
jgi:hypothetical protein